MPANRTVKRIALINPFQITSSGYDIKSVKMKGQCAEPPLGLAYISAVLKKADYEVKIFDAHIMAVKGFTTDTYSNLEEAKNDLIDRVIDFNPDVLGISCLFHYIHKTAHEIATRIKERKKNIIIVMGGSYPTVSPEIVLSDLNIDFVIRGEGEKAFLNLLEALNGRFDFQELGAIAYRDGNKLVKKEGRIRWDSLDETPWPDRSDLPIEDYYKYGRHLIQKFEAYKGKELRITTLTATRGCVFDCSFCISKKIWGGGLRCRNPQDVLDEIEFLKREYGITCFAFNDDNLLINKRFSRALLQGMIDRKLDIKWTTGGMSVRGLDKETIRLAIQSGCLIFNIAIESASEETLVSIRKPVKLKEARQVAENIRKLGGYLMGLFMVGFPEETERQFFETIRFGKSLGSDWNLFSCVTPFPGSDIYNEAKARGMLPEDIEDDFERLNFRSYVLHPKYLTPEFVQREAYFANLDQNFLENPNLERHPELALSEYLAVLKLVPDHATAYLCIGRIYAKQGRKALAQRFFELARANLFGLHKEYFMKAGITIP